MEERLKIALRRIRLGDKVAAVAQPIAGGIDAIAGTNIQNCSACARRKAFLNGQSKGGLDKQSKLLSTETHSQ